MEGARQSEAVAGRRPFMPRKGLAFARARRYGSHIRRPMNAGGSSKPTRGCGRSRQRAADDQFPPERELIFRVQ